MARFSIVGLASPQLPLRVINMFAQRDMTVETLTLERHGEWLSLVLEQMSVSDVTAMLITEKLRAMVEVSEVVLDRTKASALPASA